jgi:hypothetical protein
LGRGDDHDMGVDEQADSDDAERALAEADEAE